MAGSRSRTSKSLVAKAAELAFAVPQVVAHRMMRMAVAGPTLSDRDRKEFHLMGAEKTSAFNESWHAMSAQAVRANQELATSCFRSIWSPWMHDKPSAGAIAGQWQRAALGVLESGMAPVHRKAVANARRLARTKLK